VAAELVTAALFNTQFRDNLNFLGSTAIANENASRTFTNTSYLDLDALTGGSGTISAVSVSLATGTSAVITVGALLANGTLGTSVVLSYRVSGATTLAADDDWGMVLKAAVANDSQQRSYQSHQTALTAGTNVFELQARTTAGTATIDRIFLTVTPLP
jgi:hypothetical protein